MLKLLKYIKKLWWVILILMFLIVAQAYMQLLLPDFMGKILAILQDSLITQEARIALIWENGLKMIAITFSILLCAIGVGIMNSICGATLGRNLREALYTRILHFSLEELNEFGTTSLLTRTTNDINTIKDTYMMIQRTAVFSPIMLFVAITKAFNLDNKISLIFVCAFPLLLLTFVITFIKAAPLFTKIQKKIDNLTMVLRESLTGVRVIRAFNQQEKEYERFTDKNQQMTDTIIKVGRTMSFINPIINMVFNCTYLAVFFVGFALLDGKLLNADTSTTLVNIITISNYSGTIMMSFLMLGIISIQIPRASACAKRINEVLNTPFSIKDPEKPIDVSLIEEKNKCTVEFNDVTFTYPDATKPTLKNISFKVESGKTTAIIGSTGSGKSSIINLLPRFFDVTSGSILVDGEDVRNYSIKDLRDKIGFVPQTARLFSGTVRSNLLYGNPNASEEEILEALKVSQALKTVLTKSEKGIDSEVNQGGKNFSGGQKQRLAIARALLKKPEIYIFDDSFSALDFKTEIKLRTELKNYVGNSSVIVVAQRVSTILDADNIIVLNDGEIVGQGTHNELLETCHIYQQIVLSQLDKDEITKTMKIKNKILQEPSFEGGEE